MKNNGISSRISSRGESNGVLLEAGLEGAEVERRFRSAVSSMQKGEAEAAFFLVEIDERGLWRQLGFSSVIHYACEAADIGMNKAYALLRIGRRLRELHLIRRAFIENRIGWTKIREILRLKSRFSEKQVIEKAESCSYSELEEYITEENAKTARAKKASTSNLGNNQLGIFDQPDEPQVANTVPSNGSAASSSFTLKAGSNGSVASGSIMQTGRADESATSTECVSADPESTHGKDAPVIILPPERTREYVTVTFKLTPAEYAFLQEAHRLWKRENREEWKREQMLSALSRNYLEGSALQHNANSNGNHVQEPFIPGDAESDSAGSSGSKGAERNPAESERALFLSKKENRNTEGKVGGRFESSEQSPVSNAPKPPGALLPTLIDSPYSVIIHHCPDCEKNTIAGKSGKQLHAEDSIVERAICDGLIYSGENGSAGRRKRSVSPALRKSIFMRDRGVCRTPGCGRTSFLEVHHVKPVSEGGGNDSENLILQCSRCHTNIHEGRLRIDGEYPDYIFTRTGKIDMINRAIRRARKGSKKRLLFHR